MIRRIILIRLNKVSYLMAAIDFAYDIINLIYKIVLKE
jgi:hypothetical protein